jgi:UDP-2,3-diacylglucosamine pyrophosphatase LpxH
MKKLEIKKEQEMQMTAQDDGYQDMMSEKVFNRAEQFLKRQKFNYSIRPDGSPEVVLHGDNLIMCLNYYFYNKHLIVRVTNFIKNVDVMRPKVLFLINQLMEETLSVRFEVDAEAGAISAVCQHVVADAVPTLKQIELLTMLVVSVVDDSFHKFMQAIYGPSGHASVEAMLDREFEEFSEERDGYERPTDLLKIN